MFHQQLSQKELLNRIWNQTPSDICVEEYFKTGVLHTYIYKWNNSNASKMKAPCYLKESGISDLPYTLWNQTEVDEHNAFLDFTNKPGWNKPYIEFCPDAIVLLNNIDRLEEKGENPYICCLDVDSEDELYRLYLQGFPVFTTPYTLSTNKRLPHYFFYCSQEFNYKVLGRNLETPVDCDWLNDLTFEKWQDKVFNAYCTNNIWTKELETMVFTTVPKYRKSNTESFSDKRKVKQLLNLKQPQKHNLTFMDIKQGILSLDVNRMSKYNMWYSLVQCLVNLGTEDTESIDLLNDFYRTSRTFKYEWLAENKSTFLISKKDPKPQWDIGFLLSQLYKDNIEMFTLISAKLKK